MILAKDLRTKYDKLTRVQYKHDYSTAEFENMYEELLNYGIYDTSEEDIAKHAKTAGYVVKEEKYEKPVYRTKVIKGFFGNKYEDELTGEKRTVYSAKIFLPEIDPQIENKSSYNLLIITNKGGNSTVRLDNMSMKEVATFVENAYKIGALATGTGYISTSIIDKIDIKEIL